jgi:type I restriction enzyme S subunit
MYDKTVLKSKILADILSFNNGKSIKPGGVGRYPVYGSNGVIGFDDKFQEQNALIIGRVGAYCGSVYHCKRNFWASDNTIVAYPKSADQDIVFLYYLLKDTNLNRWAGGAAQPLLTQSVIKNINVIVPPLTIQRKIASILSAYDDLIENNLKRIKILEEMAQNLYREWFVKFRFPGHENVRFVDSPLGKIPEGWEVVELREVLDVKYGKTLPKQKILQSGLYPVYGAGDVIGYYNNAIHKEKCVLVTSRGNGSGTVWRTREPAFITNNSLIITPKRFLNHWDYSFAFLVLKHSNVYGARTGSAQPQVTIENLNYVKVIVPAQFCVKTFCSIVTPLYEFVDLIIRKNSSLRNTRDLLLPKLISGELDVSALDIKIEEEANNE